MSKCLRFAWDGKNRKVEAIDEGILKKVIVQKQETGEQRSFSKWNKEAKAYFRFLVDNHNP